MATDKYFLQMSECKWPDHIFISRTKTFKICIYHRDAKKHHPSLYCDDTETYPVKIELLTANKQVLSPSKSKSNNCKWSVTATSGNCSIQHSFCEFKMRFDSVPVHNSQPLRLRFTATSHNPKIAHIEPFLTREFRVVRYQLKILEEPPPTFYKDDGGMRNNHMAVKVALMNPLIGSQGRKHKMCVALQCRLVTEDGREINGTMRKKGHQCVAAVAGVPHHHPPPHDDDAEAADDDEHAPHNNNGSTTPRKSKQKQKQRPPLHYLQLHEDCQAPLISQVTGECVIKFRINDVSQNHKNQGFHVVITPNTHVAPELCEVYECRSAKIMVKSKSPEKLHSQKRGQRGRKRSLATLYVSSNEDVEHPAKENGGSGRKRRSARNRRKKVSYKESVDGHSEDNEPPQPPPPPLQKHNGSKRRSRPKRASRGHADEDDDEEYKPQLSDASEDEEEAMQAPVNEETAFDVNMNGNGGEDLHQHHHHHNGIGANGGNGGSAVKLEGDDGSRKRRKLNSSRYLKVSNGDHLHPHHPHGHAKMRIRPKTFNVAPTEQWFPTHSQHHHQKSQAQIQEAAGPEAEFQLFAQRCYEMLSFREWVCIGYQTQFTQAQAHENEDEDDGHHEEDPQTRPRVQIVRCLLCHADGVWSQKAPRHAKHCEFIKLKRLFRQIQSQFGHLTLSATHHTSTTTTVNTIPMPFSSSSSMAVPPPTFIPHPHVHAHHHHHHHGNLPPPPHTMHMRPPYLFSSHHVTPLISPANKGMANLPPLPSHPHAHAYFTSAHIPPPFGAPPMFVHPAPPPPPPYLLTNHHNRPPPLMRANSSTSKTDNSANRSHSHDSNDERSLDDHDHGASGAGASGDGGADATHPHKHHKNGGAKAHKHSPLLFPFAQQSPQIFASVPMHSPSLFGVNNVPQTPQMFAQQPLSGGNAPMFLPAPAHGNASGAVSHHSSMKTKISQFAATSATLPMPLTVMTSSSNSNASAMDSSSPILNGQAAHDIDMDHHLHHHHHHHHLHHHPQGQQSPLHAAAATSAGYAHTNGNDNNGTNLRSCASSVCNTAAATVGSSTANGSIKHRSASSHSSLNACTTPTPPHNNALSQSTLSTSSDKNAGNVSSTRSSNDSHHHRHHHDSQQQQQAAHHLSHSQIAVSVDSVRTSHSHSASLSAVATAGGLTVNTPLPSISSVMATGTMSINTDVKSTLSDAAMEMAQHRGASSSSSSLLPTLPAHIVLPQLQPSPKTAHASTVVTLQHSCNSIETQIGSTLGSSPPLCHPHVNVVTSSPSSTSNQSIRSTHEHTLDADKTSIPLHQRRSMGHAPSMLNIP